MRRRSDKGPGLRALAGVGFLLLAAGLPARAQMPQPTYPTVEQRSGLLNRYIPHEPWLPRDPYRDSFYDTRWTDCPDFHPNHPNWFRSGGLYGRRWPGYNTVSYYPYFFGSPGGETTMGPGSVPWHQWLRIPQTFLHPFRPVAYYYDQGSYAPVYDLDPIAPGPGPCPSWFPFYLKDPHGG
jgi:hypothetical protein